MYIYLKKRRIKTAASSKKWEHLHRNPQVIPGIPGKTVVAKFMPGFSNVRYRFYSDIVQLTAVLVLHEHKIAHPFDKVSANLRTVIEEISIL